MVSPTKQELERAWEQDLDNILEEAEAENENLPNATQKTQRS